MCHFKIVKYTGCGCEIKLVMSICSQGDGTGNCSSPSQCVERVVRSGVCGRSNCTYYEYQRSSGRWSSPAPKPTPESSISSDIFGFHPRGPAPRPTPNFPAPEGNYTYADCDTRFAFE